MESAPKDEVLVEIRDLCFSYEGEVVLDSVNLSVKPLDYIAIIGPNGGGKTTLLKMLLGLLRADSGVVKVCGEDPVRGRSALGYVPQHMQVDKRFPVSVWDIVRMGRLSKTRLGRRYSAEDDSIVEDVLRQLGLLSERKRQMGDLSGGQRQQVLLARALASQPKLLLLDEPTASVDAKMCGHIYELLGELNKRMSILMVTHDIGVISSYVKTVGCLNRRLHYHGKKELSNEVLEEVYQCSVELIAHGVPHRVLGEHVSS